MKKVKELRELMSDPTTSPTSILSIFRKTYTPRGNDSLREFLGDLDESIKTDAHKSNIYSNLFGWLSRKENCWWINQDPEVRPLNNFSKHPIDIFVNGIEYHCPTTEAYFQAAKFFNTDWDWAEKILTTKSAASTKSMGNSREHPLDPDWQNGMAVQRMLEALFAKYRQHEQVRKALKVTTNKHIIERADWDSVWGDGPDGEGKNYLGRCWMFVREIMI